MRKFNLIILIGTVISVALLGVFPLVWAAPRKDLTPPSDVELLRNLFFSEGCVYACYYGIEPGRTTPEKAEKILSEKGIPSFRNWIYGDSFEIYADDVTLPLKFQDKNWPRFSIFFDGERRRIEQVWFPRSFTVSRALVIEAFGPPDYVTYTDFYESDLESYSFVYLSKGMYFSFDVETHLSRDARITLLQSVMLTTYSGEQGNRADQPCTAYGTAPCFVPTATPSALPIKDRDQSLDAEHLRHLFLSPDCEQACYLGIEPGITTLEETQAILEKNNLMYEKTDLFMGGFFYSWDAPKSYPFPDPYPRMNVVFESETQPVLHVNPSLSVSSESIIKAFGSPDEVFTNHPDIGIYSFLYFKKGMVFSFTVETHMTRTARLLTWDRRVDMGKNDADQPCEVYGTFPCYAPTATPMPVLTLTPMPSVP